MTWPQRVQDAGFEEKRASSVYKGILDLISLTRLGTHTYHLYVSLHVCTCLYCIFTHLVMYAHALDSI